MQKKKDLQTLRVSVRKVPSYYAGSEETKLFPLACPALPILVLPSAAIKSIWGDKCIGLAPHLDFLVEGSHNIYDPITSMIISYHTPSMIGSRSTCWWSTRHQRHSKCRLTLKSVLFFSHEIGHCIVDFITRSSVFPEGRGYQRKDQTCGTAQGMAMLATAKFFPIGNLNEQLY